MRESAMISTDRWRELTAIVEAALACPKSQRVAYIEARCGHDTVLLDEALAMVTIETGRLERLSEPLVNLRRAPPVIAAYDLGEEIGRGGMATVYRARSRDGGEAGPMAIKVLDAHFALPDAARRFARECEILQRFEHPHIAAFLGSGTCADGRPFLVMELIDGVPIDHFCSEQISGLRERLALFRTVCNAVSHAHRKLVVHRDLKPSNILITPSGAPRLLDFGIAKLLDPEHGGAVTLTRLDARMMTPQYASPEQLDGEPASVSCDVYSLGVVLYELLVDGRPYDGGAVAISRQIQNGAPVPPSRAATTNGVAWSRRLRGDLDTIVLKALERHPDRRYRSVAELADDLDRHLDARAIRARPAGWGLRIGKFVRRHRRSVVVVALAMMLGALFLADRERQRHALAFQRDRAVAVRDFLFEVFGHADPRRSDHQRLEVRDVLDRGVEGIEQLSEQPVLQADLAQLFGQIRLNFGDYTEARSLLDRALTLHLAHRGPDSPEVAADRDLLGQLLAALDDLEASAAHLEQALAMRRAEKPPDPTALASALNNLALTRKRQGRQDEAEALGRENLALREEIWGPDHPETASGLNNLGFILQGVAPADELIDLYSGALEIRRQKLGRDHPDVAVCLNNLGAVLLREGRNREAEPHMRAAVTIWQRTLGIEHVDVLTGEINLAVVQYRIGDVEAALRRLEDVIGRARDGFGDDHVLVQAAIARRDTMRAEPVYTPEAP